MTHVCMAVAWLVAGAWLYKFVEAAWGFRKVANLALPEHDRAPVVLPAIVVIAPARNEEEDIAQCLESLLAQDCENLRVIAVDDRSTDATGAIMEKIAAQAGGRLDVLHIGELPAGWLGKTHALAMAARVAMERYAPEYLLFTDGDVIFEPSILRRTLARAIETRADHFVVMPTTIAKTVGEAAVLSFLQVISLWAVRPWRVADPKAKHDAIGIGAFNLIRSDAYRQIGGFDATPMEVLEDLYLGRRIKWAGLRQEVAIAPGMVSVHWAAGAQGIVNGMTKNIFAVFRFRPALLLAAAAGVLLDSVGPAAFTVFPPTRTAGVVGVAAVLGVYAVSARANRISAWYALAFPLAGSIVVYAMLRSMFVTVHNNGVEWRGTFYSLDELRRGMARRPR
jgi:GT2 family glycosyltransferase